MAEFKPVNRLEELLVRAAGDPSARPEFLREVLASEVLLLRSDPESQPRVYRKETGEELALKQFPGDLGPYTPMFTSRERVAELAVRMRAAFAFVAMRGSDAFSLLAQHPDQAALNPGLACGTGFTPGEIRRLADGTVLEDTTFVDRFGAVPHGAQLRAPAIYPQRLVDALIEEFRERPAVEAAFVAELYVPADLEPPHPVIGILSSVDAFVTICQQVGPIAEQAAGGAGRVDFAYMGHQEADRITTYLRQETTPFYQRVASKPWWKLWK